MRRKRKADLRNLIQQEKLIFVLFKRSFVLVSVLIFPKEGETNFPSIGENHGLELVRISAPPKSSRIKWHRHKCYIF